MVNQDALNKINSIFEPEFVVGVYLFGSQKKNTTGPLSDYDFGILFKKSYLKKSRLQKVMHYIPKIAMILRVDENLVDLVDITDAPFPIAFAAISGRLIYTKNNIERINFEVKTMAAMMMPAAAMMRPLFALSCPRISSSAVLSSSSLLIGRCTRELSFFFVVSCAMTSSSDETGWMRNPEIRDASAAFSSGT